MSGHWFRQWPALIHYTALRDNFCIQAVCREHHPRLTTDLGLQLRRGTAHRQARVVDFLGFDQTREHLCLIKHSVDMLRLRQLLRFAASEPFSPWISLGSTESLTLECCSVTLKSP